jgi:hypothetical protein
MAAMLMPKLRIDVSVRIKGRYKLVAVPSRSIGKFFRAGEIEPDTLEIVR